MVDKREAFTEAYERLNPEQREAVDAIDGPVMVIAGPGTGKTQILTLRIANIIWKTDTPPENILALTFTDAGARAMRERLRTYLGADAYRIPIHTFHGFSEMLIRQYPDAYPRIIGGRIATDIEKIDLLQSILDGGEIMHLRPFGDPSYYVTKIQGEISTMKREHVTPDDFAALIAQQETELSNIQKIHEKGAHKGKVRGEYVKKEKSIGKNRDLLHVYRQYEALLSSLRLYDYDDMIALTIVALEHNEDMLRDLQETYQYVLADEHQDVNGSQNRILELVASYHERPNIFVVGDEKQAIFRFQGASLENFLYFEDMFSGTKTIALTRNYRSGQRILDAAHSLIAVDGGPQKDLRVPLIAEHEQIAQVERREFPHQVIEDAWLVEAVQSALASGVEAADIAVIVRTNREVEAAAGLLRQAGIAVRASADGDVLDHPILRSALALAEAAAGSEEALISVLHGSYWNIAPADIVRILASRRFDMPLAAILASKEMLTEAKVDDPAAALHISDVLTRVRALEVSEAPHRVLQYLLSESGFLDAVVKQSPLEGVRIVRRLYDEIETLVRSGQIVTLRDAGAIFAKRRKYGLSLNAPAIESGSRAVHVMTAHKSKGLEFDTVFIAHLTDNLWGGGAKRTYFDIPLTKHIEKDIFDADDDERRLLYVAMTRAKVRLVMTNARTSGEGRELTASRLFSRIDEHTIQTQATEHFAAEWDDAALAAQAPLSVPVSTDLVAQLFFERGLSATHLNNYLESPWNYFYRNLLRYPEVQGVSLQFGTAIHNVLERAAKQHTEMGSLPSDTEIRAALERELSRLAITNDEFVRLFDKGQKALFSYIPYMAQSLPNTTRSEFNIRVILETGDATMPEIPLTGKLDRLDLDADGRVLRVVDYKTGKPKSRAVVEGKTRDSNGNYKRQLVFYALLLSLYGDQRYLCRECTLSYVEPDAKGTIIEHSYTITDEEIEALKADIIRVAQEITSGAFLNAPCDPASCNYCDLVDALRMQAEHTTSHERRPV